MRRGLFVGGRVVDVVLWVVGVVVFCASLKESSKRKGKTIFLPRSRFSCAIAMWLALIHVIIAVAVCIFEKEIEKTFPMNIPMNASEHEVAPAVVVTNHGELLSSLVDLLELDLEDAEDADAVPEFVQGGEDAPMAEDAEDEEQQAVAHADGRAWEMSQVQEAVDRTMEHVRNLIARNANKKHRRQTGCSNVTPEEIMIMQQCVDYDGPECAAFVLDRSIDTVFRYCNVRSNSSGEDSSAVSMEPSSTSARGPGRPKLFPNELIIAKKNELTDKQKASTDPANPLARVFKCSAQAIADAVGCCVRTVHRAFAEEGVKAHRPTRVLDLTPQMKADRTEFSKTRKDYSDTHFQNAWVMDTHYPLLHQTVEECKRGEAAVLLWVYRGRGEKNELRYQLPGSPKVQKNKFRRLRQQPSKARHFHDKTTIRSQLG